MVSCKKVLHKGIHLIIPKVKNLPNQNSQEQNNKSQNYQNVFLFSQINKKYLLVVVPDYAKNETLCANFKKSKS